MQRKLAAVLSADVVGYSRLMAADEEATLARLQSCLGEIVKPAIADHRGRVVKLTGDGVLAEFASVVDAVRCAVAVQEAMTAPDGSGERAFEWRIGVNLGDIMVEADDIFGDGVNVAARLQELAEPGGILISGDAWNQVRGKLDFQYDDLGAQSLKNIPEPVAAYRVRIGSRKVRATHVATPSGGRRPIRAVAAAAAGMAIILAVLAGVYLREQAPPDRLSIAVLPFDNMSGDPEQDYFADGMAEDIITDLSKISGLFVIARNSSFGYRGQSPDIREVGRELGVRYVVEGSVRKAGGQIRINVQLIDAGTGLHVWAERYDSEEKDIFDLQDEVRGKVVAALKVKLTPDEETRLARRLTNSPEAYDLWLRGRRQESFFTKEANLESRRLFEQAIEIDPDFAAAYASLGTAYQLAPQLGWRPREEFMKKGLRLVEKAVALDGELPSAHWALARATSRSDNFDGDRAIAALEKAISLDPNYADAYAYLASVMTNSGRAEEALGHVERAMRLNPRFPFWYFYEAGKSQFMMTRYEAAVESFEKAVERNPNVIWPHHYLAAAYGQAGRIDDAEWELEELRALGYEMSLSRSRAAINLHDEAYLKRYIEGLSKAGVPE